MVDENNQIIPSSEKLPKYQRKVDLAKALKLRFKKGWTFQMIADHFQVKKQTIHNLLYKYSKMLATPAELEGYDNSRADILNGVEWKLIEKLLDTDKLKKASLNNVAYAFQAITTARRLESGKSTANVAVNVEQALADALRKSSETDEWPIIIPIIIDLVIITTKPSNCNDRETWFHSMSDK